MSTSLPLPIGESSAAAVRIVLSWLIRLRWLAVVGQAVAIGLATALLDLRYPLAPLAAVIATTLLTNVLLVVWLRSAARVPRLLTPGVLVLDVALLTVLLYFTGGTENPFAVLYVVHVAMATVVLGPVWAWAIVLLAAACYALLIFHHLPFQVTAEGLPDWARVLGEWSALLLVAGLLAYFIGHVMVALRRREQELATVRERAQLNERLASLTTLAAGAAHELGTPLGTIAVVAKEIELAARQRVKAADGAELAEDAALIRQQVERCRQIIEHMRGDVAGRTTDAPGWCRADEVIEAVRASLHPERRARLAVELGLSAPGEEVPRVAASCQAVQQAVQLLVNNAFDASPEQAGVRLTVGISEAGATVQFRVTDTGRGMDPETLRRATEPFFTTKDPGRGMGLGLFLVRLVADRNGGRLEILSEAGVGTDVILELPVVGTVRTATR